MRNGVSADFDGPTAFDSEKSKIHVLAGHGGDGQLDQEDRATLQELPKRQPEDIESQVDPEDGIGQSVRTTITEAKICIPLRIEANGKHSCDCYRDENQSSS